MIGLIRNFSSSPLLFPPVELIALEQWSGGELEAKSNVLPQMPVPAEMRRERKRKERIVMVVYGEVGRYSTERK